MATAAEATQKNSEIIDANVLATRGQELFADIQNAFRTGNTQENIINLINNVYGTGGKYDDVPDQMKDMLMQQGLERMSQLNALITNWMKMLHDAAMRVIGNMRG